jgi:hypothetical protein
LFQDDTANEPEVLLLDVYRPSTVQPLNVSVAGVATLAREGGEFVARFARRAPVTLRRNDLHGAHFKTATVVSSKL